MKLTFWRRRRVHRIGLGDLVAMRNERWSGRSEAVRIHSVDWRASLHEWEPNEITIRCSQDPYRVTPKKPSCMGWWLKTTATTRPWLWVLYSIPPLRKNTPREPAQQQGDASGT